MHSQLSDAEADVWGCLAQVMDPELDEPVTEMGFVESVKVVPENQAVEVEFRLPTYWCSPNFAFLMAFDMRDEIGKLSWVQNTRVMLIDHCFGDQINNGVNGNRAFSSVFSEYCNGESLDAVRIKFLEKAFIRRQEAVLLELIKQDFSKSDIVTMTLQAFDSVSLDNEEAKIQKPRYRSLLLSRGLAENSADPAFVTWSGERLRAEGLSDYLSESRGVRINMEFNGALCRGLKGVRYKEVSIDAIDPIPVRFVRDAVSH